MSDALTDARIAEARRWMTPIAAIYVPKIYETVLAALSLAERATSTETPSGSAERDAALEEAALACDAGAAHEADMENLGMGNAGRFLIFPATAAACAR